MLSRVLVSDPIANEGIEILSKAARVDVKTGLSKEELIAIIGDYDALAVRSETKVTAEVLEAAKNLKIIGRAGVGVDNIDVVRATERGILVVNSPEGNTIAASELTVAMLLALSRNIPQADAALRNGEWKRSKYVGVEVYKKTLGVIGLGKIGREVTRRLLAFGMQVLAYDPYVSDETARQLGVRLTDLETIYREADYITLHIPKTKDTAGMIGAKQLAIMKKGVRIVNVARGGLIDELALAEALKSGHVGGAAIDVYSTEPAAVDNPLLGLPNVVHTPHLGASTAEAQVNVAIDIAEQIVDVLAGNPARAAVNMPSVSHDVLSRLQPYLTLGEKIGSLLAQLASGRIDKVEVVFGGDFGDLPTVHIVRAVLKGVLDSVVPESVNYVNAPTVAQHRGIQVIESKRPAVDDHTCLLTVRAYSGSVNREVCGTVFGRDDISIVHIDGFRVDIKPRGAMLVTEHNDRPGIIGKVGTLLGEKKINIGGMHVGRSGIGQRALMVLLIDEPVPAELVEDIKTLAGMESARQVQL
ncbi:MAG: phosphoglycerate dehydrogenase [Capsulimonadaceae bacterium]|nr:phosphoglycerate dehydrogenase [Capsulimonadaceae bacterium]